MKFKILFLLCITFQSSWCQHKVGYWLESDVARIPFEIVNQSLFVKVNLNEHDGLSFLIDTGSSFSVVFTDAQLQLPVRIKTFSIRGFGKLDSIPAYVSTYNNLSVGALTAYGQQILVVEKDQVGFQQFFDKPLHGIIGLDALRNYDLEINFVTRKLVLRKNGVKEKKNKQWSKVPFNLNNNALLIPALLSHHQNQIDSIQLVLDTGSQLPLILKESFCPPVSLKTIIGLGFLGHASGSIAKIVGIRIGDLFIDNIVTAFPDSSSVRWNPLLPQHGNLGIDLLRRYRIIINYKEKYLQLKPIRKLIRKPPSYNRSGMAVVSHAVSKGCAFYIDEIAPGSPAARAGLLKGDRIASVNKTQCPELSLEKINKYIFSKNPSLKIKVLRDYSFHTVTIDLRDKI